MKRFFTDYLTEWKERIGRKPLIVRGARQVGKTYTIAAFGHEHFNQMIKINFEETPDIKELFVTNDVQEIIRQLEYYNGSKIKLSSCLLFLDEIQACPEAIVTLRYFYEKMPELHVIAAGSLLDHVLNDLQYAMPVGRVEFAYMYPLNFYEFLHALGEAASVEFLNNFSLDKMISLVLHNKLLSLTRSYFIIGGMPEAVSTFANTKSLVDVDRILESLIRSLEFDFSKYGSRNQQQIMTHLLKYIPKSLGQKFKYVNFDNTLRSDVINASLQLLNRSRIIKLVHSTSARNIPLYHGLRKKFFKPLFLDIGLVNNILKLKQKDLSNIKLIHEGGMAEQFIGQELLSLPPYYKENDIYYWAREKRNSEAEIDYLIELGQQTIPIEVKAGKTGTLKSLHVYMKEKDKKVALRLNADLPSVTTISTSIKIDKGLHKVEYKLISLPLYLVQELKRFVTLATP